MKNLNLNKLDENLRAAAEVVLPELEVAVSESGAVITAAKSDRLTVKKTVDGYEIGFSKLCEFCRGLSRLTSADSGEVDEKSWMTSLCYMVDASRNAVPSIDGAKKLMRLLALMGYDSMMLYTEDTYELPEYPYFGYMRGRYSSEEIRELVAYGEVIGIELIPCVQTLAHYGTLAKRPEYAYLFDTGGILMVGEDKTYEFIEAIFRQCAACFKSRKINIGMDEAHTLGRGRYMDKHGYRKTSDIMLEHLERVVEIAHKYGFEPMMWSDMFFRMQFGGKYSVAEGSISEDIIARVPKGLTLVYWTYSTVEENIYENMFNCHMRFDNPCAFAGGAWKWSGFATLNRLSLEATGMALKIGREKGVTDIISTGWGDNGGEASQFSNMATNLFYAEHAYGNISDESMDIRAKEVFGESFETLMLFDLPNALTTPENSERATAAPSKYMLFNDPLMGLLDRHFEADRVSAYYAEAAKKLYAAKDTKFGYAILTLAELCSVLELKADLGIKLRAAYKAGDRAELARLANEVIPEIIARTRKLLTTFRKQWYKENKTAGFSTQDIRLGGLMERLAAVSEIINLYLDGEMEKIEELEADLLAMQKKTDGKYINFNNFTNAFTPGIL